MTGSQGTDTCSELGTHTRGSTRMAEVTPEDSHADTMDVISYAK